MSKLPGMASLSMAVSAVEADEKRLDAVKARFGDRWEEVCRLYGLDTPEQQRRALVFNALLDDGAGYHEAGSLLFPDLQKRFADACAESAAREKAIQATIMTPLTMIKTDDVGPSVAPLNDSIQFG